MTQNSFDIIVFGATSFVGQIMTRYMKDAFAEGGSDSDMSWAIAGRSADKLSALSGDAGLDGIERIVADSHDEESLRAMCARAKVIVSTVGPYALYGDTLVKVCAETGTHYCDLTGEPQWIRKMQAQYEDIAKKSGARIVHCCGFDSIPSDLGVHVLQKRANKAHGQSCHKVKMRVAKMKGGASGGTIASMINMVKEATKDAKLRKELKNPYSLCPPGHNFTQRQRTVKPAFDKDLKTWITPFIMEAINARVVHRSNALKDKAYGNNFLYEEAMITGKRGKHKARIIGLSMTAFTAGLAVPPMRWFMESFVLPKPGEGPSPKEQLEGSFDLLFMGTTPNGDTVKARVTGDRDPGYGSTGKMLAEAAACLAKDLPKKTKGGFWTPASLMGDKLVKRLEAHAGLTFEAG